MGVCLVMYTNCMLNVLEVEDTVTRQGDGET